MLSDKEKKELKDLAFSLSLKADLQKMSQNRHNPFLKNGKIELDCLLAFLCEYNDLIDHKPRPLRKIKDEFNKL
jgi:hypothetical protein